MKEKNEFLTFLETTKCSRGDFFKVIYFYSK